VHEVPVGKELAARATSLLNPSQGETPKNLPEDGIHPYQFDRRESLVVPLAKNLSVGGTELPAVLVRSRLPLTDDRAIVREVCGIQTRFKDAKIEGLIVQPESTDELPNLSTLAEALHTVLPLILVDCSKFSATELSAEVLSDQIGWGIFASISTHDRTGAEAAINAAKACNGTLFAELTTSEDLSVLKDHPDLPPTVLTLKPATRESFHPLGAYRRLSLASSEAGLAYPIWIRSTDENAILPSAYTSARIVEASMLAGPLLCDGVGDLLSCEIFPDSAMGTAMAFNILQGARVRVTRTEYVACPSCGRTLFDLQSTTASIREKTDHLKGVTIAVMGCIVNGPGEMADADFGYVGGAPGKINLYVGKECVKIGIPQKDAVDRLVDLIRAHGKWVDPT
jgi:(E)-4-hydroxy-3-methylbut-2-enyl-diphosphate synthase